MYQLIIPKVDQERTVREEICTDEGPPYVCHQKVPLICPWSDMQSQFLFAVASDAGAVCGRRRVLFVAVLLAVLVPMLARC